MKSSEMHMLAAADASDAWQYAQKLRSHLAKIKKFLESPFGTHISTDAARRCAEDALRLEISEPWRYNNYVTHTRMDDMCNAEQAKQGQIDNSKMGASILRGATELVPNKLYYVTVSKSGEQHEFGPYSSERLLPLMKTLTDMCQHHIGWSIQWRTSHGILNCENLIRALHNSP